MAEDRGSKRHELIDKITSIKYTLFAIIMTLISIPLFIFYGILGNTQKKHSILEPSLSLFYWMFFFAININGKIDKKRGEEKSE